MIIIGLGYQAQCGKDTVAAQMLKIAGGLGLVPMRRALADSLKEECAELVEENFGLDAEEVLRQMHSSDPRVKKRWRLLMQWWGTEGRRYEDPGYWVNLLKLWLQMKQESNPVLADRTIVFVPDVRFLNEAAFIKSLGGFLINVVRPDVVSSDSHESENELANYGGWDAIMVNDGTLEDLEVKSWEMLRYIRTHYAERDTPHIGLHTVS